MRKLIIIALLIIPNIDSFAQRPWLETSFTGDITDKLEARLVPQLRYREALVLKEYFVDAELRYEISEIFKLGVGYRMGRNIKRDGRTEGLQRLNADLMAGVDMKGFKPKIRLRYCRSDEDIGGYDDEHFLRYKAELEYDFQNIRIEPYILYEIYHSLDRSDIEKGRTEFGFNYKINKKHRVGTYFRHHQYFRNNQDAIKIIGLIYRLKVF